MSEILKSTRRRHLLESYLEGISLFGNLRKDISGFCKVLFYIAKSANLPNLPRLPNLSHHTNESIHLTGGLLGNVYKYDSFKLLFFME